MGELGPWVVLTETSDRAHYLRVDRPAKTRPTREPLHPNTERWWKRAEMKPGGFAAEAREFYEADLPSEQSGVCPYDLADSKVVAIWREEWGVFQYEQGVSDMVQRYIATTLDTGRGAQR